MNTKPIQQQAWTPRDNRVRVVVTTTPEQYKRVDMAEVLWSIRKIEACIKGMMQEATTANSSTQ